MVVRFDGTNDSIVFTQPTATDRFTAVGRVRPKVAPSSTEQTIIGALAPMVGLLPGAASKWAIKLVAFDAAFAGPGQIDYDIQAGVDDWIDFFCVGHLDGGLAGGKSLQLYTQLNAGASAERASSTTTSAANLFEAGSIANYPDPGPTQILNADVDFLWIEYGSTPLPPATWWSTFFNTDGTRKALPQNGVVNAIVPDFYEFRSAAHWNSGADWADGTVTVTGAVVDVGTTEFPTVRATATGRTTTTDTTTHAITLPASIVAGERLVVVFSVDGNPTITINTGVSGSNWSFVAAQQSNTTIVTSVVVTKIAQGSDVLTLTTSVAEQSSHISAAITGGGAITATGANGSSTNANPPSHNAGSAASRLWLSACSVDSTVVASAEPAGHTSRLTHAAAGTGGASTGIAWREYVDATQDPGTFTTANEQWVAWTIAIDKAVAAGITLAVPEVTVTAAAQVPAVVSGGSVTLAAAVAVVAAPQVPAVVASAAAGPPVATLDTQPGPGWPLVWDGTIGAAQNCYSAFDPDVIRLSGGDLMMVYTDTMGEEYLGDPGSDDFGAGIGICTSANNGATWTKRWPTSHENFAVIQGISEGFAYETGILYELAGTTHLFACRHPFPWTTANYQYYRYTLNTTTWVATIQNSGNPVLAKGTTDEAVYVDQSAVQSGSIVPWGSDYLMIYCSYDFVGSNQSSPKLSLAISAGSNFNSWTKLGDVFVPGVGPGPDNSEWSEPVWRFAPDGVLHLFLTNGGEGNKVIQHYYMLPGGNPGTFADWVHDTGFVITKTDIAQHGGVDAHEIMAPGLVINADYTFILFVSAYWDEDLSYHISRTTGTIAAAAAGGATIAVPAAAVAAAPPVPVVASGGSVTVAAPLAATVAAQIPDVVSGGLVVLAAPVAVVAAAPIPAVLHGVTALPPVVAVVAAAAVPAVAGGKSVAVPVAAVTAAPFAPAIVTGVMVAVPDTLALATPQVPVVASGGSADVPASAVVAATAAPAVLHGVTVLPPAAAVTILLPLPGVAVGAGLFVPLTDVAAAAHAPRMSALAYVPASTVEVAAVAPSLASGKVVSPPAAAVAAAAAAPTVLHGTTVQPPAAAVTATANAPGSATGVVVALPAPVALNVGPAVPSIAAGKTLAVPLTTVATLASPPDVWHGVTILMPAALISVLARAPGAGSQLSVPAANIDAAPLEPEVASGGAVDVPAAATAAMARAPVVLTGSTIEPAGVVVSIGLPVIEILTYGLYVPQAIVDVRAWKPKNIGRVGQGQSENVYLLGTESITTAIPGLANPRVRAS